MVEYRTLTISSVCEETLLIVSMFCSVSEMGFYVLPYTASSKTEEWELSITWSLTCPASLSLVISNGVK